MSTKSPREIRAALDAVEREVPKDGPEYDDAADAYLSMMLALEAGDDERGERAAAAYRRFRRITDLKDALREHDVEDTADDADTTAEGDGTA